MNALPLVSVVVPNYNYKRYLNLRIQSILQQTYQNIELILLDDASTDGSEEVLSDYQDHAKVSHILLNEHNTGNPFINPEKPDVPLNKNDAFQKVQKRRVQEKR